MPPKVVGKYVPLRNKAVLDDSYDEDYYPALDDPNFLEHLITRQEFWKLRTTREPTSMEEKCKRDKPFRKFAHQEFLENYINVATPYNGILVFQGVGSGKTGAAILIALGFQDVLKRLHKGDRRTEKKKILVLTPGDKIKDNFIKDIFSFDKYFRSKKGLKPSEILAMEGESQQITGTKYMPDAEKARTSTAEQIMKSVRKKIMGDFEFMNHQAFANRLITLIGKNDQGELWNMKPNSLDETQRKRINKRFRNRVMIIDEIHNVRDNENNIVPPVLEALVQNAENLRIVLMSATPMVDSPREIIYLLNLLLMNDRRPPLILNEIFDKLGNMTEEGAEKLKNAAVGYISYLRSETPDRFPLRVVPEGAEILRMKYDWKGRELDPDQEMKYQKILPVEMSRAHYDVYHEAWEEYLKKNHENENESNSNSNSNSNNSKKSKNGNKKNLSNEENEEDEEIMNEMIEEATESHEETIETKMMKEEMVKVPTAAKKNGNETHEGRRYMPFIYLSNIWLPCKDGTFATNLKEGYGKSDKGKGPFQEIVGQDRQGRKYSQYRLRGNWAYENNVPFIDISVLPKYSTKMAQIFEKARDCRGITLISSQWLPFGVYPMALIMEQNGIKRFLDPDLPDRQLLDTKNLRGGPHESICAYCGQIRKSKQHVSIDHAPLIDNETYPGDVDHVFKEAKYALVTGDTDFTRIQDILMSPGNKWGGEIKVIIGSDAIAEGVNTNYIRQVHIMEPRFNWSTMEQIVGRATRNCSHVLLPQKDRNVDVFYWAAMPPKSASKKEQETELVNMRYYRRAELKDVRIKNVEYILKIAAVDCYLNKNANLFLPKDLENWLGFKEGKIRIQDSLGKERTITMGDTPYSRICDYRATCDYKCVWEPKDPSQVKINPSTYSLVHARSDIDRAKRIIRSMYQKYQRNFFDLAEIQAYITNENGQYVAPEIIHKAVEELISVNRNGNPTLFLSDPYHRKGYLVYRGRHYVWQPIDIENKTIPVKARWEPLTEKPELFPLRSVEVNNLRDELHKNKPAVKENKKEKKLEKDTDSATLIAYVMERVEILRSQWSAMIESQELVDDVLVAMVLDRLERANFHYLILSDLLIQMTDEPQDLWNDELLPSFVRYYQYNWVSAPSQDGKPPVGFFWDGQLYVYHKQDIKALDDSNKNTDKLFNSWNKYIKKLPPITVQSGEDAERSSGRIWRDPEIMSKIFGMMEYFKGKEWIFKIVDIMKEKGTKTVQQTKSKRSESRGKKCENFKLPELRTAIELAELPINSADITSKTSCFIVEFYLRQFDILFKNKKRWFITANEIYLMNPSK